MASTGETGATDNAELAGLVDDFLAEEVEEHPVLATSLGIDGHDDRLGEFSEGDFLRRQTNDASWLERFCAVEEEGLSLDDHIDRDLVVSTLQGRVATHDWTLWRRDPAVYLEPILYGVFELLLHRPRPEPELAADVAARLRAVPGVLSAARANLDPALASPVLVERAAGTCRAGIQYARRLAPAEIADLATRRAVTEAGEVAAGALEGFAAFLEELGAVASGSYAIGHSRYSALLIDKERLGYGATEMRERGRTAYDEIDAQMGELASRVEGTSDWREVMVRLKRQAPPSPDAMVEEYRSSTERARRFLLDTGVVTVPDGEQCLVVPSPTFQRSVLAVAFYIAPPPFRASLTGHFFVPCPPEGASDDEVAQRLADNSRHTIPTTSVHEAYPGHHWHLATAGRNPRPARKVFQTSYFAEGWALYAEAMMAEHGFFEDPRDRLGQLDARIFRAARIIVDTSLHIGDMSVEEAVRFMSTKTTLTEATARAEVARYCAWPTQASSYLTGAIEIERIRGRYLAEGGGTLTEFHDRLAGSGTLPIALAEQAVLGRPA